MRIYTFYGQVTQYTVARGRRSGAMLDFFAFEAETIGEICARVKALIAEHGDLLVGEIRRTTGFTDLEMVWSVACSKIYTVAEMDYLHGPPVYKSKPAPVDPRPSRRNENRMAAGMRYYLDGCSARSVHGRRYIKDAVRQERRRQDRQTILEWKLA